MSRFWALFAFLGLLLLHPSPLRAEVAPPPATIEADLVEVDLLGERTYARGDARLSYGDLQLRAAELTADRISGDVDATGRLELMQAKRRLSGRSLHYNLHTRRGSLKDARAAEQGVIIRGDEIALSPTEVIAHHAYFTTCDRPEPHFIFGAETITLTGEQVPSGEPVQSGRLTLDRARIIYRGRKLFTVPKYSVHVGDIGKPKSTPLPVTGFSRDDGPYASIGYTLGEPTRDLRLALSYRYTTSRGIRGYLKLNRMAGPAELTFGYIRREDPVDRTIEPDDLESNLASVLVNREPEYGLVLPEYRLGRWLFLQTSWLSGSYTELSPNAQIERAAADRTSLTALVRSDPYSISPTVKLSHAVGWRQSRYSPGDEFTIRLFRNTAEVQLGRRFKLELSHVSRRASGESPFLFDGLGPPRELLTDLTWVANPAWRLRAVNYYDLEDSKTRDMILEATRTAHCLEYTLGWRKQRGTFYVGFGLAPPACEASQGG